MIRAFALLLALMPCSAAGNSQGLGIIDAAHIDNSDALSSYPGNRRAALAHYRADAARIERNKIIGDDLLRTARALYVLGDVGEARTLWKAYVDEKSGQAYLPMMLALHDARYRTFFTLSLADSANYTLDYPEDRDTDAEGWLTAGLRLGQSAQYIRAQSDFQQSLNCITYDSAYPLYAWAAAAYARGERTTAHAAWLYASTAGKSYSGDMEFKTYGNAAAVTMLLGLYSR